MHERAYFHFTCENANVYLGHFWLLGYAAGGHEATFGYCGFVNTKQSSAIICSVNLRLCRKTMRYYELIIVQYAILIDMISLY